MKHSNQNSDRAPRRSTSCSRHSRRTNWPPSTTSPLDTIQAISTLFATTATLHSAVAHAAEIAIKTEKPQIVEQTTRLLELMARDRHTLPSPRQVDS